MTGTKASRNRCVLLDWGDTVMKVFAEYQGKMASWPEVEAMPGIRHALEELHHSCVIALATNAADSEEEDIRMALRRVHLDVFFDHVFCARTVGFRKPDIEFYLEVLHQLGLSASSVVMVGDCYDADIVGATAAGIEGIWFCADPLSRVEGRRVTKVERLDDLPTIVHALLSRP